MCSYSIPQSAPQVSFHSDQTCFYHILATPIQCAPTISHINLFPCVPYSILNKLLPRRYFPNVHNLLLPFSAIITTSWMPSSSVQIPCCLITSYILPDLPYCSFVPTPTINFPYSDYFPRTSFRILYRDSTLSIQYFNFKLPPILYMSLYIWIYIYILI